MSERVTSITALDFVQHHWKWLKHIARKECELIYQDKPIVGVEDLTRNAVWIMFSFKPFDHAIGEYDTQIQVRWHDATPQPPAQGGEGAGERNLLTLENVRSLREWAVGIRNDFVSTTRYSMADVVIDILDFVESQEARVQQLEAALKRVQPIVKDMAIGILVEDVLGDTAAKDGGK